MFLINESPTHVYEVKHNKRFMRKQGRVPQKTWFCFREYF